MFQMPELLLSKVHRLMENIELELQRKLKWVKSSRCLSNVQGRLQRCSTSQIPQEQTLIIPLQMQRSRMQGRQRNELWKVNRAPRVCLPRNDGALPAQMSTLQRQELNARSNKIENVQERRRSEEASEGWLPEHVGNLCKMRLWSGDGP